MIRWAYLKRVLAGAIFGLYIAHLLYFLNPQIDITPGRLAIVTIVYGLICGLLFGSVLWGLRALRVRLFGRGTPEGTYRTHGFGFVVFAAFLAAAIYWTHLKVLRIAFYLPIGAVRLLSKATNVITFTAFLLLALWVVERNADRRLSRAIFLAGVVLIAVSSFWLYQRRESYRTEKRTVVVANIGAVAGQRPVIVVAVRNLPYDWIVTLSGEGLMPYFEQAADNTFFTRLEPFPTTSPKALWASLATGKLPYRHGVTGRFSYRTPLNGPDPDERFLLLPSGVGFRGWGLIPPVQRISAQLPAGDALPLWTMVARVGMRTAAVNWQGVDGPSNDTRVVTDRALRTNLPSIGALAQRFNGTGAAQPLIVRALAADLAAAAQIRSDEALDVVALDGFYDTQRALHLFSNALPGKTTIKGEAVRAYAQQLDRVIASIVRDHPQHLVVVCSPSAVAPPPLPSSAYALLLEAIRDDDPGSDDGFVLITGPGVAHHANPESARVVDVVPTVLFAAGLPVGRDMDGRILTDAFAEEFLRRNSLTAIQTYEAKQLVVRRAGV